MRTRNTQILALACSIAIAAACSSDPGLGPLHGTNGDNGGDGTADDGSGDGATAGSTGRSTGGGSSSGSGTSAGTGGGTTAGTGGGTTTGGTTSGADGGASSADLDKVTDPLSILPKGADQLKKLCAAKGGDAVTKAFCGATPPTVTSLVELQKLLGLDFKPGNTANGRNGNPGFALTGASSSLVARFTSAINPRAIIFTPPPSTGRVNNPTKLPSFVAMGFVRGEEFVELISNDPTKNDALSFFLFKFEHTCSSTAQGCNPGELLTPAVESNFTGVYSLYGEDDIKNTVFDCQQCHQPAGPASQKIMRMSELQNPWGHFFRNNRVNGQVLLADYNAAHATTETYAGIPGAAITNADPAQLEGLVENEGFRTQPGEYQTARILSEVQQVNANQPASNDPPGASATWMQLYNAFATGQTIAPPYHDIKVTDPTKLATATTAYKAVMAGTMPAAQLPDIREIFLDSALRDMGFKPKAGSTGPEILTQMCVQCHNKKLDQTETREKFRVDDLAAMSREEKDLAIHRLQLPKDSFRKMPPPRFRELEQAEIDLVVQELKK